MVAEIIQFPQDAALTAANIDVEPMASETQSGGDGGGPGALNERVVRLETHFEYIRDDLKEIKRDLKVLPTLATKRDLVTWAGIYLLIAALIVGGIIGGLAWIKPEPVASAPAVVQPSPPATTGASTTGGD